MNKLVIEYIPQCEVISYDFKNAEDKIQFAKSLSGDFGNKDDLINMFFINKIARTKSYNLLDCVHAYFKIHKDNFYTMYEILGLYRSLHSYVFDNGDEYFVVNLPYSIIFQIYDSARSLSNQEIIRKKYNDFLEYLTECYIHDDYKSTEHINTAVTFDIKAAKKDLDELERLGISTNIRTNYLLNNKIEKQFILPKQPIMGNMTRAEKAKYILDFGNTCQAQLNNFNKYKVVPMLGNYVVDHQYLTITAKDMEKIVNLMNDDSIDPNLQSLAKKIYLEWVYVFGKYERFV